MGDTTTQEAVRMKFPLLEPLMTERLRRQWAACEAESLGRGGVNLVARATGLSRTTIWAGRRELRRRAERPQDDLTPERVRAPGGGRHLAEQDDPALSVVLRDLVESSTRGNPQSPLFWTSKSTRTLAEELCSRGHSVSHQTVAALLADWGYSLQANRKTKEGQDHPDRDAQFEHINRRVREFQRGRQPVVSVDAKKKELVGDFRNPGRQWRPKGRPEEVRAKDFKDKRLGKAIPEGVYDLSRNEGWVSVGVDHDTAEFAVESLRRWWQEMGSSAYPRARRLLITADAGGSNGCQPTAHRFVFSARSSLSQRRPEPTAHRSDCDAPDRHRIAQLREGPLPVRAPPTIPPASISGLKPGPRQQGGVRRAAVALDAERAADRHPLARPMSVLTHLQRSDALSVT